MTRPEELLTDALHERVDHRHLPATPMGDVVSAAGRIRRRRRIRNGAVTAVVVAVLATPFVLDASRQHPDTSPGPVDDPPTAAARVRLAAVAQGPPPAVPWLDGSDYVAADGTRTTLPFDEVLSATPYGGGFLVAVTGPDLGPRVVRLDGDLHEVWRRCGQARFAVSSDRTRTAYASGMCSSTQTTLVLGPSGGGAEQSQSLPVEQSIPVGIVDGSVVTGSLPGAHSLVVDFKGPPRSIGSLARVEAVGAGRHLASGQLAGRPGTAAVVDTDDDVVLWQRRGWSLSAFSPDGSMVLGVATGRGGGFGVFDARSGDLVHSFGQLAGFRAQQTVWEDDEHLLSVTTQGSTQAILRLTLDGAIERATATAPYAKDGSDISFRFAPSP